MQIRNGRISLRQYGMIARIIKRLQLMIGIFAAACLLLPATAGAYSVIERSDTYRVTFDDLATLAGGVIHQEARHTYLPSFTGEIIGRTFTQPGTNLYNASWIGDSHIQQEGFSVTISGSSTIFGADFRSLDGLQGTSVLSFDRPRNAIIEDGHYVFRHVNVGGSTTSLIGSPFSVLIELEGDWSGVGTASGQHLLEAINPLWSIDRNFEFDGTNTIFQAHIAEFYPDGAHRLDLAYSLHANPVPEPEIYAMMGLGLGLMGWVGRRRKQQAA